LWPSRLDEKTLYQKRHRGLSGNSFIYQQDIKVNAVMEVDHSLRDKLRIIWPILQVGRLDEWLWMHEWRQHGYSIEGVLDVTDYFNASKTINELMISNLVTYLKDQGINPKPIRSQSI
ncbi:hypothetical protein MTR67_048791, partial [Solanum verrucosum]